MYSNEKHAVVIGSYSCGLINCLTEIMRNSMVFMAVFFIGGFIILQFAKLKKSMA
jgi:MFS-type transporter involved in bile tolerance (Atg22 family)